MTKNVECSKDDSQNTSQKVAQKGPQKASQNASHTISEAGQINALTEILQKISSVFDEKVFAIGDTCVAAIHYQALYEGMESLSFATLREDYNALLEKLIDVAKKTGLICDHRVEFGGITYKKPYSRIGDGQAWVNFYPLDEIPYQTILRFKVLKESRKAMTIYKHMEQTQDFSKMPAFAKLEQSLRRYSGLGSKVRTCLFSRPEGGFAGERSIFQKSMEEENLFPTRQGEISGIKITLPAKVNNWTTELTSEYKKILEIIHGENLDSLERMDKACKDLKITYFLVGGSMLGAVRHGGFIPWDDDVDVGFLRRDYRRFIKEAGKYLGDEFSIQLPNTDPHIHFVYARLRKKYPLYITTYNHDKDFNKGLWIDAFPFDAMPKSKALAKLQRFFAFNFARASQGFKRRREYAIADMKTDLNALSKKDRRYLKRYRVLSALFPVGLCRFAYNFCARFFNPFYANGKNTKFASFIPSYTTISAKELIPIRYIDYEDIKLAIPKDAESFLSRQYGDYKEMPPVHERYSEHGFKSLVLRDGNSIIP